MNRFRLAFAKPFDTVRSFRMFFSGLVLVATVSASACGGYPSMRITARPSNFTPALSAGSSHVLAVTDQDFSSAVLQNDSPVLVHFWAAWCSPCLTVNSELEQMYAEYSGKVLLCKLDVDTNPDTTISYGLTSVPACLLFKNGKLLDTMIGAAPQSALEIFINRNLQLPKPTPATSTASTTKPVTSTAPVTTSPPTTASPTGTFAYPTIYRQFIRTTTNVPSDDDVLGEIRLFAFASHFVPLHYLSCDGSLLSISHYTPLYSVFLNSFGGNGTNTFALPDFRARPMVAGTGYAINVDGSYPSPSGTWMGDIQYYSQVTFAHSTMPVRFYIGEVILASNLQLSDYPWLAPADGRLLPIVRYDALYALVGNDYGGNGDNVFAVPDLSKLTPPVAGAKYYVVTDGIFPQRPN